MPIKEVKLRDDAPPCPKACGARLTRWTQYYGMCPTCGPVDRKPISRITSHSNGGAEGGRSNHFA
ncbi:MAG: hypothetical protein WCG99_04995 [Candidatus Berkelbacteria bacterium]|uniref:hypothetical protein n=1 Tax=Polynucleobacter sp. TaxID=2029855 RepID=UPI00301ACD3F